jgi:hypothetical protein
MIRSVVVSATLLLFPYAATAAELPVPKVHKVHRIAVHRPYRVRAAYAAKPHFGYYFGQWGWRWGGTERSWYGSTFAFAGASEFDGAAVVRASPKGIAAIDCPDWRPDACLAEPVLTPVVATGSWR